MASVAQFKSIPSGLVISNSTTAYADITGLAGVVLPNTNYRYKFGIIYTSAATTTGAAFSMNGPASPTLFTCSGFVPLTATTAQYMHTVAYDTNAASASSLATANYAEFSGIIEVGSAGGTFIVRFASEVAASAITVQPGSWLEIRQT